MARRALTYRDEMEGCEFVNDEKGIRQNLAQMEKYIDPADPAELINLLIRKAAIGRDHAIVNYKSPMPKDGCPKGTTSERIPLPFGSVTARLPEHLANVALRLSDNYVRRTALPSYSSPVADEKADRGRRVD